MSRTPGQDALDRLGAVKADPESPSVVFQRLCDGEELRDIAKAWGVPKGRFLEWFTTEHADLFEAALRVRAADLAIDAMNAALAATPEDVAVRKLQADVALKLAAKFDRVRFGETVRVEKSVTVGVDAGLLGTAGELLRLAREKTIAGAEVLPDPEGPAPARLVSPAPRPLDVLI